ncbi:hypothetical protein AMTRI_Chr06g196660 [Amborella trichopoda]
MAHVELDPRVPTCALPVFQNLKNTLLRNFIAPPPPLPPSVKSKLSTLHYKGTLSMQMYMYPFSSLLFYNATLTDKLAEELGNENVKLHSKVLSLSYSDGNGDSFSNWSVSYIKNQSDQRKLLLKQSFDAVVMTAPIRNMQEMQISKCGKPYMLDFLPNVMYLPLSIIVTTFKKENVKLPLEGFGVLVPSKEQGSGLRTLGTLFSSMMFPDRAPKDQYLYTTFVGGSRNRNLASASLDELREVVTCDLKKLLGVVGAPTFVRHVYWGDAFPLYGHNYDMVLKAIEKMEQNLPGFFYAGNHRGGLSVGKSIASGWKAAELVLSHLNVSQSN